MMTGIKFEFLNWLHVARARLSAHAPAERFMRPLGPIRLDGSAPLHTAYVCHFWVSFTPSNPADLVFDANVAFFHSIGRQNGLETTQLFLIVQFLLS